MDFKSAYKFMQISLENNLVEYNYFIGPQSSLFSFIGGLVKASSNLVQYNGKITNEEMGNNPINLKWGNDTQGEANFSFGVYSAKKAQ